MEATLPSLKVCTKQTSHPEISTEILVSRILMLAEAIMEKRLFMYQKEFAFRMIEAVINHEAEVLTALFARQSGKTEVVAAVNCALSIMLPVLANSPMFVDDWRFNLTDEQGNYRGFKNGFRVGIYAPKQEQADISIDRVRQFISTPTAEAVFKDLNIFVLDKTSKVRFSHGSFIVSRSASEQSKIEGATYDLLVLEEAQDIGTLKVRKSLHPMVTSTGGCIIKIGTCSIEKSDFYSAIKSNKRSHAVGGVKNHFEYNYKICQHYNSLYRDAIEKEKKRIGEFSDEFRLSYACEWILERGMFITWNELKAPEICIRHGLYGKIWTASDPFFQLVAGIDWGKVHDSTIVTVMAVDWRNPLFNQHIQTLEESVEYTAYSKHVVGWLALLGDDYESQFAQITEYLKHFRGLRKIVTDANGVGQWGLDRMMTHYGNFDRGIDKNTNKPINGNVEIVGFTSSLQSNSDGYKLLHSDLKSHRLTLPAINVHDPMFRRACIELTDLRKEYRNGMLVCRAPDEPDAHDDMADSLMMANWGAQTPVDEIGIEVSQQNNFLRRR